MDTRVRHSMCTTLLRVPASAFAASTTCTLIQLASCVLCFPCYGPLFSATTRCIAVGVQLVDITQAKHTKHDACFHISTISAISTIKHAAPTHAHPHCYAQAVKHHPGCLPGARVYSHAQVAGWLASAVCVSKTIRRRVLRRSVIKHAFQKNKQIKKKKNVPPEQKSEFFSFFFLPEAQPFFFFFF